MHLASTYQPIMDTELTQHLTLTYLYGLQTVTAPGNDNGEGRVTGDLKN